MDLLCTEQLRSPLRGASPEAWRADVEGVDDL
jgi:hypothetical protein